MSRRGKVFLFGVILVAFLGFVYIITIPKYAPKNLSDSSYSQKELDDLEGADYADFVNNEADEDLNEAEEGPEKDTTIDSNKTNLQVVNQETSPKPSTQNIGNNNSQQNNGTQPQKVSPQNNTQEKVEGNNVMSGIVISEAERVTYDRAKYQPNWNVGVGCDIRSRILTQFSLLEVQFGANGCTVKYGSWSDPYSGRILTGNPYQGDGTQNDLDIDHIIPLNYVNSHGGYYWPDDKKRNYGASLDAMNKGVYVAVSATENRKKGDKGPSEYYPPNTAYRCEYSRRWRDIARIYSISLSLADYNIIMNTLMGCGIK